MSAGGYFVGLDITRDGGPNTAQSFFNFTNVSNFFVVGCNFVGGPSNGNRQDIAFNFTSTFNSSNNTIGGCQFQDMATVYTHQRHKRNGWTDHVCAKPD